MDVDKLKSLRQANQLDEARKLALSLLEDHPHDPDILLQTAYIHDQQDMAPQAISFYKQALEHDLNLEDRREALLCLGSSYRAVGLYELARETLEIGMSEYPDYNAFYIFFAMTLYNLDDTDLAMEFLMTKLLETTDDESIKAYSRALEFYSSRLDEVFN
ncbi:tetratricopeptide repeat protein [Filobacillus milosensis]|nr:tetratricopeptide repeat protein [Filobacillus milosensis]